ncbi:hypothetical protein COY95_00195 [Candidatus Woesearchaeota archaeon CG_4_10_14_0_8_um_filter_47_5]|nr:MAG: hypothetical protein COY95_00195 [Candidatus Woesearchaeota archaeon CG_4_10_14_0_8_um_filter_47_5]
MVCEGTGTIFAATCNDLPCVAKVDDACKDRVGNIVSGWRCSTGSAAFECDESGQSTAYTGFCASGNCMYNGIFTGDYGGFQSVACTGGVDPLCLSGTTPHRGEYTCKANSRDLVYCPPLGGTAQQTLGFCPEEQVCFSSGFTDTKPDPATVCRPANLHPSCVDDMNEPANKDLWVCKGNKEIHCNDDGTGNEATACGGTKVCTEAVYGTSDALEATCHEPAPAPVTDPACVGKELSEWYCDGIVDVTKNYFACRETTLPEGGTEIEKISGSCTGVEFCVCDGTMSIDAVCSSSAGCG